MIVIRFPMWGRSVETSCTLLLCAMFIALLRLRQHPLSRRENSLLQTCLRDSFAYQNVDFDPAILCPTLARVIGFHRLLRTVPERLDQPRQRNIVLRHEVSDYGVRPALA